jgi:PIN domain nuclease of toxin-antitoxin system
MAHKYVIDTHALVWHLELNPRLSPGAGAVLNDPYHQFVLPVIALAEAVNLVEKGRSTIPAVADLMASVKADRRFVVEALTLYVLEISLGLTTIPEIHDRLIVAAAVHLQAQHHTVAIVTRDAAITRSGLVPVIW